MNRVCSICGETITKSVLTTEDAEEYREQVIGHYREKHPDLYIFLDWLIVGDNE